MNNKRNILGAAADWDRPYGSIGYWIDAAGHMHSGNYDYQLDMQIKAEVEAQKAKERAYTLVYNSSQAPKSSPNYLPWVLGGVAAIVVVIFFTKKSK